jgi:hypothetical protein
MTHGAPVLPATPELAIGEEVDLREIEGTWLGELLGHLSRHSPAAWTALADGRKNPCKRVAD